MNTVHLTLQGPSDRAMKRLDERILGSKMVHCSASQTQAHMPCGYALDGVHSVDRKPLHTHSLSFTESILLKDWDYKNNPTAFTSGSLTKEKNRNCFS